MTAAQQTLSVLVAIAALAIFVWLLLAPRKSADDNAVINPSDPRQLALLIGMTGGSQPLPNTRCGALKNSTAAKRP